MAFIAGALVIMGAAGAGAGAGVVAACRSRRPSEDDDGHTDSVREAVSDRVRSGRAALPFFSIVRAQVSERRARNSARADDDVARAGGEAAAAAPAHMAGVILDHTPFVEQERSRLRDDRLAQAPPLERTPNSVEDVLSGHSPEELQRRISEGKKKAGGGRRPPQHAADCQACGRSLDPRPLLNTLCGLSAPPPGKLCHICHQWFCPACRPHELELQSVALLVGNARFDEQTIKCCDACRGLFYRLALRGAHKCLAEYLEAADMLEKSEVNEAKLDACLHRARQAVREVQGPGDFHLAAKRIMNSILNVSTQRLHAARRAARRREMGEVDESSPVQPTVVPAMTIIGGVQDCIESILDEVDDMKALMLDNETQGIIDMVFPYDNIFQRKFFWMESIDKENQVQMRHLTAVCVLRPTDNNFSLLSKELRAPRYKEYHVIFTNCASDEDLLKLARSDEYEVLRKVRVCFADVYAINHDFFSLKLPSTIQLTEKSAFNRMIDGILAACLTLRMKPVIRYARSSWLARECATHLQQHINDKRDVFDTSEQMRGESEPPPVLVLLDRSGDPVTPLLNQWTYQAMLHELLEMDSNHIDMSRVPGIASQNERVNMSVTQDKFFSHNMLSNFQELTVNVQRYSEECAELEKIAEQKKNPVRVQSFMVGCNDYQVHKQNASKHVAAVREMKRIVLEEGLCEASLLGQDIVCSNSLRERRNFQEHKGRVFDMVRGDDIKDEQRLRLVLLYALRYKHQESVNDLQELMRSKGVGEEQIALVDHVLRYADSQSGDLFENGSLLTRAKRKVASHFTGAKNVEVDRRLPGVQHSSRLYSIADRLMNGTLEKEAFPLVQEGTAPRSKDKVMCAMIFVIGGATFEEARDVAELNMDLTSGRCLVLGGTTVHNSRTFLDDVAEQAAADEILA